MNPENGANSARTNKKHLGMDGIPENKGRSVQGNPFFLACATRFLDGKKKWGTLISG